MAMSVMDLPSSLKLYTSTNRKRQRIEEHTCRLVWYGGPYRQSRQQDHFFNRNLKALFADGICRYSLPYPIMFNQGQLVGMVERA